MPILKSVIFLILFLEVSNVAGKVNHGEVIVGRLKHLVQGIRAAEAQSFDWPASLLGQFRRLSDDQLSAIRVVASEVQKAAEEFQK